MISWLSLIAPILESVTKTLGFLALIWGGIVAVWQIKEKWQGERIERDTKLVTHFSDLMKTAHARDAKTGELETGVASQDAAIAAIWQLGRRHKILRPIAIQALTSLVGFKSDVTKPYLDDLVQSTGNRDRPPAVRKIKPKWWVCQR